MSIAMESTREKKIRAESNREAGGRPRAAPNENSGVKNARIFSDVDPKIVGIPATDSRNYTS
jgi:hypothetical protein